MNQFVSDSKGISSFFQLVFSNSWVHHPGVVKGGCQKIMHYKREIKI